MSPFRAFRIHQHDGKVAPRLETIALDDLAPGEVTIEVQYSGINFKDALAATGAGKILRRFPLVGGIDLAGVVSASSDASIRIGQPVLVTGCGLSETQDGGYAQYARVKSEWVIPLPQGMDAFQAMALGTAGFTAALAIHRMEQNGQTPGDEILVTGASGGVGSLAIDMLATRGYRPVALTGKRDAISYLEHIGATRVLTRDVVATGGRPLEDMQWAGAIDNVGGETLSWLMRTTRSWGNIASVGMASSIELKGTVLPLILRGVNLLGVNSVYTPRALREVVWRRLASDLKPRQLDKIVTRSIDLEQLPDAFDDYIRGSVIGRTVVRIG